MKSAVWKSPPNCSSSLANAALSPRKDVAVVLEAVARQRRRQLRIALADAMPGGPEILPLDAILGMAPSNLLARALGCLLSDPPQGVETDAVQTNLGRLPSRYDLVAAGALHLGGAARAQGADAVRQRRTERQGVGRAQRRLLRAGC